MSVSNLTSRQLAVGQSSAVVFRRVYGPLACATNERPKRLQRPVLGRPVLRETPKLRNDWFSTRSEVEVEKTTETGVLTEEKETANLTAALEEKIFRFEDEALLEMSGPKEEGVEKPKVIVAPRPATVERTAKPPLTPPEKKPVATSKDAAQKIMVAKRPVMTPKDAAQNAMVAKRPTMPTKNTAQNVLVAKRPTMPTKNTAQNVLVAKRPTMPTKDTAQNVEVAKKPETRPVGEDKPSVLAAKRPEAKPPSPPKVVDRRENVLVVKKSNGVSTEKGEAPPRQLPGRVIERPRPKAPAMQPLVPPPKPVAKTEQSVKTEPPEKPKLVHTRPNPPREERPRVLEVKRPSRRAAELPVKPQNAEPVLVAPPQSLPAAEESLNAMPPLVQEDFPAEEKQSVPKLESLKSQDAASEAKKPSPTTRGMEIRESLLRSAHILEDEDDDTSPILPPPPELPSVEKEPGETPAAEGSLLEQQLRPRIPSSTPPSTANVENAELRQALLDTENQRMDQTQDAPAAVARRPEKPPSLMQRPVQSAAQDLGETKQKQIDLDRQFFEQKAIKAKEEQCLVLARMHERREQKLAAERERRQQEKIKRSDPTLIASRRRARQERQFRRREAGEAAEREMIIEVGAEGLSVEALAQLLAMDPAEVIKTLFVRGVMVTVNQTLDMETVKVMAGEVGVEVLDKTEVSITDMAKKEASFCEEDDENAIDRPPVVTVMGHVDHGKTSLLDYIRQAQVVKGEAGGITQAIGAYTCSVEVEGAERMICFLDTPGHEAFSAMRARGTKVTDIAVIVIAANDGIRPQTLEAVSHAKAAEVPMVVAINKMDVDGADPERVKRELSELELLPEEWGGQTPVVCLSAKTGEGVPDLLEMLTLVSDIQLDLRANPEAPAKGTVVEAYVDKRSGVVATLLVQNGTLHVGDAVVAGGAYGRIRSLTNELGQSTQTAGPSLAVQMLGFHEIPSAGDLFSTCADEAEAKEEAEKVAEVLRLRHLSEAAGGGSMVTMSSLASVDDEDSNALQRLNLILKGDTSGSVEAVKGALAKLPQEAVIIRLLHAASGEVTESDVLLAAAAGGMIVKFNVPMSEGVAAVAKQKGVDVRSYNVIYDLIDDVRDAMEGRLSPGEDLLSIGQAEVRAVFGTGSRRVAGCMVTEGRLEKDCHIKILRKKVCVHEGIVSSLRRVKDDVDVVQGGLECGVGCESFSEWQEEDRIEASVLVQKRRTLEESRATVAEDLQEVVG